MVPSLDLSLFIKLHDVFDEFYNSFFAKDGLVFLISQNLLLSIRQIKLREQWRKMCLFEPQMS